MGVTSDVATLHDLAPGSHVCWIVDDDRSYRALARDLLRGARASRDKALAFGPAESADLAALRNTAIEAADPRVAFLDHGPLHPEAIYSMFREKTAEAHREGYERLFLVADMDWLLPAGPTADEVTSFELLLDRHAQELDATIICAYRTRSFHSPLIESALAVHPINVGVGDQPQFRIFAGGPRTWRICGEVDVAVERTFERAIATVVTADTVLDLAGLKFIDVAGLRVIARSAGELPVRILGAPQIVRRIWETGEFALLAPGVEFAA